MKTILIILGIILVFSVIGYVVVMDKEGERRDSNTETRDFSTSEIELKNLGPVPDLVLSDYQGNKKALRSYVDSEKIIVYNSWATWCPFCVEELPAFAELQEEYGEKIHVIAINRREDLGEAKGYTDQQGTSSGLTFLLDPSDSFYREIGGFTMPETLFVDSSGEVRVHKRGNMTLGEMRTFVEAMLVEGKREK